MSIQIFKKVLIPVDGSQNAMKAAKKGIQIAKQNGAKVFILYVIDLNFVEDIIRIQKKSHSEVKKQLEEKAKIYVREIQKLCEAENLEWTEIIKEGDIVNVIVKDSKTNGIDLIVQNLPIR